MPHVPKLVLLGVFSAALLGEAAVLYFVDNATLRLYAGLALFILIGWMFAKTPVSEVISNLPEQLKRRRYPRMRKQVQLLLEEVRRLNWMAVDGHRGFRNRDEALTEMDAIEDRMRDIVGEIRREAGVASDEPDQEPAPQDEAPGSTP